jgi:tellurite resistance protein
LACKLVSALIPVQFLRLIHNAIFLQAVCVAIETASAVDSTVLREKLIIARLVKKFFSLSGTSQFVNEIAATICFERVPCCCF